MSAKQTITLTWGDIAQSHTGMQALGTIVQEGYTIQELQLIGESLALNYGVQCEFVNLREEGLVDAKEAKKNATDAAILVIRQGAKMMLESSSVVYNLWQEQFALQPDTKALMKGVVRNKIARHNLCFGAIAQAANFKEGKGTVIAYADVPVTKQLTEALPKYLGEKAQNLLADGNYYYDVTKCGIRAHGDSERKIVIGLRLGASMPLDFHWFQSSKPVGKRVPFMLHHGDFYIMSEKASGNDWRKRNILTLRHCAGAPQYMKFEDERFVKKESNTERQSKRKFNQLSV